GMFPIFHLGRPWLFYWLFPYPNTMTYWPNFRSPLVWDVFAVTTYLTISLVFWFVGLIPDLASMRDQTSNKALKFVFGAMAMGWIVCYGYAFEAFMNWYGGDPYESFLRWNRLHGPYAWSYYTLLFTNLVVPQVLWFKTVRTNPLLLFFVSLDVLVGMWLER